MAENWSHGQAGWPDGGHAPSERSQEACSPRSENPLDPQGGAEAEKLETWSVAADMASGSEFETRRRGDAALRDRSDDHLPDTPGGALDLPDFVTPRLAGRGRGPILARPDEVKSPTYNPEQRLLILDCWIRSGLPAGDFAPLVGLSKPTLFAWKKRFEELGPAGLLEPHKGARSGSRLPELTRRTILLLKQSHPDWGCERISQMLLRGPALPASPSAVTRALPRPATSCTGPPRGRIPTRSATSSGPGPISSGRPTCSPSSSSGRTAASTWSRSSTITAGFSSASASTPVSRRRLCSRSSEPPSRPTAPRRRCSPTTARSTSPGGARAPSIRSSSGAASARSSRRRDIRRPWERSSGSGARSGVNAWKPRCSSTWPMPARGSGTSSTGTISSARTAASTAWPRPTATSGRPPTCCAP